MGGGDAGEGNGPEPGLPDSPPSGLLPTLLLHCTKRAHAWPQRTFPQSSLQTQPGAQREGEGALQPLKNSWRREWGWVLGGVWGPRTVTQGCQAFGHM